MRSDCIEWPGFVDNHGYGRKTFGKHGKPTFRRVLAHRLVWEECFGPVPDGLVLDHLCRNKICVNPEHLEPVSQRRNVLRGIGPTAENARKTHCIHGHEFTDENTLAQPSGRLCRECKRVASIEYRQRKKVSA